MYIWITINRDSWLTSKIEIELNQLPSCSTPTAPLQYLFLFLSISANLFIYLTFIITPPSFPTRTSLCLEPGTAAPRRRAATEEQSPEFHHLQGRLCRAVDPGGLLTRRRTWNAGRYLPPMLFTLRDARSFRGGEGVAQLPFISHRAGMTTDGGDDDDDTWTIARHLMAEHFG